MERQDDTLHLEELQDKEETQTAQWSSEYLYSDGDEFFNALISAVDAAEREIMLEVYMFNDDEIGRRVMEALERAVQRGVTVRVMVDSIGSLQSKFALAKRFEKSEVQFQVYHQLPWERLSEEHPTLTQRSLGLFSILRRINRRTHRKYTVIDGERAFVGGMNFSRTHLCSLSGDAAWRDNSAQVVGPAVIDLVTAFERIWNRRHPSIRARYRARVRYPHLVRLNHSRRLRRRALAELLSRIRSAKVRIWIASPYFVPHRRIRRALSVSAKRGVDVRIILPERADVFFLPWVANRFYEHFFRAGARLYEYTPSMLHAKTLIIDDWCVVGSTNLNHRSVLHDLEVDVVLDPQRAGKKLVEGYERDVEHSREVTEKQLSAPTVFQRMFARVALLFERYL